MLSAGKLPPQAVKKPSHDIIKGNIVERCRLTGGSGCIGRIIVHLPGGAASLLCPSRAFYGSGLAGDFDYFSKKDTVPAGFYSS